MTSLVGVAVVAMTLAVCAFAYFLFEPSLANLRSEQYRAAKSREEAAAGIGTPQEESTPILDLIEKGMNALGWRQFTDEELANANIKSNSSSVVAVTLIIAAIVFCAGLLATGSIFFSVILMVAAPILVRIYVNRKTEKRRGQFADQIEEAMQLFSSGLKAGMNVPTALAAVSRDISAPMGEELTRIVNENSMGRDLVDTMKDCADRMDSKDFLWVTEAVAIQRESGGRLTEILDRVVETIQERSELQKRIRALSSESTASAYILMSLPILVAILFSFMQPGYLNPMFQTFIGNVAMLLCLGLYAVGGIWLRKVTKVDF